MLATILFQLQQTRKRLHAQPAPLCSAGDQPGLRIMLNATIRQLHELNDFAITPAQRTFLVQRVRVLEQESQALAPPGKVVLGTWNLLHTYLTQTIEASLEQHEA